MGKPVLLPLNSDTSDGGATELEGLAPLVNGQEWVGRLIKANSSQTDGVMRGARGKRFDHATDDWQLFVVYSVTRLGATAEGVSKWALGKRMVSAGISRLASWR